MGEQPGQVEVLRVGDFQEGVERRLELSALDVADSGAAEAGQAGEGFLRQPALLALRAQGGDDTTDGFSMEINAHAPDAMGLLGDGIQPYMATRDPSREPPGKAGPRSPRHELSHMNSDDPTRSLISLPDASLALARPEGGRVPSEMTDDLLALARQESDSTKNASGDSRFVLCPACFGSGIQYRTLANAEGRMEVNCPRCNGKGRLEAPE